MVILYEIYEMTTNVRFCLSYDPLKRDLIAFQMSIVPKIKINKRFVDTDVVNGITCMRQSIITRLVIRFYDIEDI